MDRNRNGRLKAAGYLTFPSPAMAADVQCLPPQNDPSPRGY